MPGFRLRVKLWYSFLLCSFILGPELIAQNWQQVWADEFNGTTINRTIWEFESGQTNDNVHFYTDRLENARIVDGKLQIIALKESFQGSEYTSALLKTEHAQYWRYGRIEARIKLPVTNGFVPAFWMMSADSRYGWWPLSGEIDIMEHPTNEVSKIYGTVHTEDYNLFSGGLPPQGGVAEISDAESAFHVYAIEWREEQIDFFVDDQKYYSFLNDNGESNTWPFDQSFYIILNLAVGGGWVGNPGETTVFPALMEVDYVRVYQNENDVAIQGAEFVPYNSKALTYNIGNIQGAGYQWSVPGGAKILSGQNTPQIMVDWGIFGGDIEAEMTTGNGSFTKKLPVKVSYNYLKNPGFEKGVKYWNKAAGYPVVADFRLNQEEVHKGESSIYAKVTEAGSNSWDVQLSQQDITLKAGQLYQASLWVKADGPQESISAAIINTSDNSLIALETISPSESWTKYAFEFTASSDARAAINIDMGDHTGGYFFDDFVLTTPELTNLNQIQNPDFFDGAEKWEINVLSTAMATGAVEDGMYAVSISNGGENAWDINLGQPGLSIENGKEYMVSFDAYADAPRQITAFVGKNADPWTIYSGDQHISITTSKQSYTYKFVMNEPADYLSRLGFDIGADPNMVYFDNVMLSQGETANHVSLYKSNASHSFHGLQNYPNPFHTETSFFYILEKPGDVTLRIFNLNGQEIETLVDSFQKAGEHQIIWSAKGLPAGVYFYQLHAGKSFETRKLLLQH